MVHTFNHTCEAEAGRPLGAREQPGLQSEFQDIQSYTVRPCPSSPHKKKIGLKIRKLGMKSTVFSCSHISFYLSVSQFSLLLSLFHCAL